ncbi:MAG: hypothetical protein JWM59_2060 [Verrucomicrobiales bacterium]|nr:hypothetical protein [Verrucomicrobiales bacterium]
MTTDQMKDALRQLHAELEGKGTADPELRDLLTTLETDIHRVLDRTETDPASDAEPDTASVTGRLDSIAAQFETEHPQMAPVLRQVGDALARMGI